MDVDFSGMTKAELLAYAEKYGIQGVSSADKKADILMAVQGAE